MTTILISGSRKWTDKKCIYTALTEIENEYQPPYLLIHGGCRGADTIANNFVEGREGWSVKVFPFIKGVGKAGGPMRNQKMIDEGKPGVALLFRLNNSSGTTDTYKRLLKYQQNNDITIYLYES